MDCSLSTPALVSTLLCIVCRYILPLDLNEPALVEKNQRHFAYSHIKSFKLPKEVDLRRQAMITSRLYSIREDDILERAGSLTLEKVASNSKLCNFEQMTQIVRGSVSSFINHNAYLKG